jgi:hypothetical protein
MAGDFDESINSRSDSANQDNNEKHASASLLTGTESFRDAKAVSSETI